MATLTDLVVGAPTSGYLASLFLNLVESSHHKALVPFVAAATDAWCKAYGIDRNFWVEKNIGSRICGWFDAVLRKDASSPDPSMKVGNFSAIRSPPLGSQPPPGVTPRTTSLG
jgi:hypothetical protein